LRARGDYKRARTGGEDFAAVRFCHEFHRAGPMRGLPAARRTRTGMANTTSAQKATRVIARRTEINKARRSRMRNSVRKVEEAIASGDRDKAIEAMKVAEPILQRSSQKGIVHRNAANRKVSRLTKRIAQLGK
jgi:small subunit ribosomal protein S20